AKRKTIHDVTNKSTPAKKPKGKANVSRPINDFLILMMKHRLKKNYTRSTTIEKSNRNKGFDDEIDNSSAASSQENNEIDPLALIEVPETLGIDVVNVEICQTSEAKRKTVPDETNESATAKKPKGKANVSRSINEFFDVDDETSLEEESTTMEKNNRNKGFDDEIDNSSAASSQEDNEVDPLALIEVPETLGIDVETCQTSEDDLPLVNAKNRAPLGETAGNSQSLISSKNQRNSRTASPNLSDKEKTAEEKKENSKEKTKEKAKANTSGTNNAATIRMLQNVTTKLGEVLTKQTNLESRLSTIEELLRSGGTSTASSTAGQALLKSMAKYFPVDGIDKKLETVESMLRKDKRFFNAAFFITPAISMM
ncbi:hypothetical protein TSAR_004425, partial [Trichomalopsis sarcophagae]